MIRRSAVAVLAAALCVCPAPASALAAPTADAGADRAALQQAMDDMVAAGAAGVQMRVHDRFGEWTGSAGVDVLGKPEPVSVDGRLRIGSITKTFVATVLLQLASEGKLRLDDPVDTYLPQFGLDRRITMRMVMSHTSGLFNYTGDVGPNGKPVAGLIPPGLAAVMRDYPPGDLVRFAASKPLWFVPGTDWKYSNTNYILAGLVVEKITGTPFAVQVYRRIIAPLGLWNTTLPGDWPYLLGPHAHGYQTVRVRGVTHTVDVTTENPSWAWAAGEIVSTTADLDRFITALLGGRLLGPQSLAEMRRMRTTVPHTGITYGLGLMAEPFAPSCVGIGHTGGVPGYLTYLFSTADRSRRVEISVTSGTVELTGGKPVLARYVRAQRKLVEMGLCGSAAADLAPPVEGPGEQ